MDSGVPRNGEPKQFFEVLLNLPRAGPADEHSWCAESTRADLLAVMPCHHLTYSSLSFTLAGAAFAGFEILGHSRRKPLPSFTQFDGG